MTFLTRLVLASFLALAATLPAFAQGQDTKAHAALLVDMSSGAILLEKNADQPLPPASMSKLMTLYMAFEALERGVTSMSEEYRTSERASKMEGSKMYLRQGEKVAIGDLIRGVIVQSGNDAAVALAEALAGTEEAFAERMTTRAAEIGLTNSTFANASGWPDPRQRMSTRDLAKIAELLIKKFPNYYPMFAERVFTWDNVEQKNRNPLFDDDVDVGADGLKTGHTEEAGYGLVASAIRGKRRVVLVLAGLDSKADRKHEAERLINWAFRAFEMRRLYTSGESLPVAADVWLGAVPTVALTPVRDVTLTAPFGTIDKARLTLKYDGPVPAPIEAGQEIGQIEIHVPELDPVMVPVIARDAVEVGGFLTRIQAAATIALNYVIPD